MSEPAHLIVADRRATGRGWRRQAARAVAGSLGLLTLAATALVALPAGTASADAGPPTLVKILTNMPATTQAGTIMVAPVVQLQDSAGAITPGPSGIDVTATVTTGTCAFTGLSTTTVATDSSGDATFSNLVGQVIGTSCKVTFSSPGLTSAVSGSFTVSAGTPVSIDLNASTSCPAFVATSKSTSACAMNLQEEDYYGNVITAPDTAITLATTSAGGFFTAGSGSTTAITTESITSGTAVHFYYGDTVAGSPVFTFSAPGLTSATFDATVTPGAVNTAVWATQPPSSVQAGVVMSPAPAAQLIDSYGNDITSTDPGTSVTATVTGSALAAGASATVTSVDGLATFSNLSFKTVSGSATLKASPSGKTASAASNAFTVAVGPADKLVLVTQPSTTATAGSALATAAVVDVEDQYGNLVSSSSAPVSATISSGPAGAGFDPLATTTVDAVSGVATFSGLVLDAASSTKYTFAFTDTGDGLVQSAASSGTTVSNGPAISLVFTTVPSSQTAGTALGATVELEDAYGNQVKTGTGATDTIAFATASDSPSSGALSGTTSRAASTGVVTPNIDYTVDGTYTVEATDATEPTVVSAESSPVTITPNALYQLAYVTQPPSITAGQVMTPAPQVAVEDRFGNVETADSSDTVTLTGPQGFDPSSVSTETVVDGVATFSDLSVDRVGNVEQQLSATSTTTPTLRNANSAIFEVSAAAPASLLIAQPQLGGQAGTGNSIGVYYLEQLDQYGNYAWGPGPTGTPLTFSSTSPTGTFALGGSGPGDPSGPGGPDITSATFDYPPNGSNPPNNRWLYFYYGDTTPGLYTITVSSTTPGITAATQQVQVMQVDSPGDQSSQVGQSVTPITITGVNSSMDTSFSTWWDFNPAPNLATPDTLPPGLSIDDSGVIEGTPTASGVYPVSIYGCEPPEYNQADPPVLTYYACGYTTFTWTVGAVTSVLTTSVNPASYHKAVTLTDTIDGSSDPGTPTGTVTFTDITNGEPGTTICANRPVEAIDGATGAATCSYTPPTVDNAGGTFTVVASYSGDGNYLFSDSNQLGQQVQGSGHTLIALTFDSNPIANGATVTMTAQVTLTSGSGTPTGTIAFDDVTDSTTVCSVPIPGTPHIATCKFTPPTTGQDGGVFEMEVTYSGDLTYSFSDDHQVLTELGNQPITLDTTSSKPAKAVVGQPVVLDAEPTGDYGTATGHVTISIDGAPAACSTGNATVTVNPAGIGVCKWTPSAVGSYSVTYTYTGDPTYAAAGPSSTFTQVVAGAIATTAGIPMLTSPASPPGTAGEPVTVTDTVTPGSGSAPTGTVTFTENTGSGPVTACDGASLGADPGDPTPATSTASCTFTPFAGPGGGKVSITALYNGSAADAPSTASKALSVVVDGISALDQFVVGSNASPSASGKVVTLTATLAGSFGVPTGSVSFTDDDSGVACNGGAGPVKVAAPGTAVCRYTPSGSGPHSISAAYTGDTDYAAQSTPAEFTQLVDGTTAVTSVVVSSSADPSANDTSASLTATVTGASGTPTGSVTLTATVDGAPTAICTGQVLRGVDSGVAAASCNYDPAVGDIGQSASVVATYSGDATYAAKSSSPFTQIEDGTAGLSGFVLAANPNPATSGKLVTITATLTGGAGPPSGTVTFSDGGTAVCTSVKVAATGVATCRVVLASAGIHDITANYSGDVNYAPATDPTDLELPVH